MPFSVLINGFNLVINFSSTFLWIYVKKFSFESFRFSNVEAIVSDILYLSIVFLSYIKNKKYFLLVRSNYLISSRFRYML